jgi:hypothetical protein
MKGAVIAAVGSDFLKEVASVLSDLGFEYVANETHIQVIEGARRLTLYRNEMNELECGDAGRSVKAKGFIHTFNADCRWEDFFCRVLRKVAENGVAPFVVLDNSSAVWDPLKLDPLEIRL